MKTRILVLFILLLAMSFAMAQDLKTLDRQYTPILFTGQDETGLTGLNKNEWTAWSWNQVTETWTRIPFQIDEVKANGGYEHVEERRDSLIKNNDQIVFMPADVGDKAPMSVWKGIQGDTSLVRMELECTDPLDTGKKGWVYLFKNVPNPDSFINYMHYSPSPSPSSSAADTVSSDFYKLGHSDNGLFNYLSFPSQPELDLLDRLKLRMVGSASFWDVYVDENKIKPKTEGEGPVSDYRGEVRLFRDLRILAEVEIAGATYRPDAPANLHYYPYSISGDVSVDLSGAVASLLSVDYIRLSLDHTPNTQKVTYFSTEESALNGINVDGVEDNPIFLNLADDATTPRWMLTTGERGTVFMSIQWPEIRNGHTWLYYRDTAGGGTEDGSPDTGDKESWSDMGMWSRTTGDGLFVSDLYFAYSLYFIDQDVTDNAVEFGTNLLEQHMNPVTVQVNQQNYQFPTSVNEYISQPVSFELNNAYPNPFQVGKGNVRFEFMSNRLNGMDLVIYNVLGQQVRRFTQFNNQTSAKQSVLWDGRDQLGQTVSPGLYFYRLTGHGKQMTGKLMIIN